MATMTGCAGTLPSQSGGLVETRPIPQIRKGRARTTTRLKTPAILQTCAAMPNKQLRQYRGCYATYFFGMDVGINLTGNSAPAFAFRSHRLWFRTAVWPQWQAPEAIRCPSIMARWPSAPGVGNTSLGSGVFQMVQVAGNNNLVISNMNININIAHTG